ncbi:hypothetical protein HRR83_004687 [Exophiala dermatitidis]|uniref:HORMA domain-containing protein n=1 Tax=Exophiala dermatitidis TaxID=5970 RepID=A0AAN6F0N4_EXODE|nr:hypothetical protein HRR75_003691 [Exophiala dermatitidis]KAJ4519290.1 hypothetical protein HRR74_004031 [Exophiala dermatitidis]KAJ4529106.1 hypothetical protein HRR73_000126 [Exophiala dermatitidis]KAJ4538507.1 hypothetical protein HRR77_006989 [Exophiala dermatitidis]KAJ4544248.1 hypothetical protein HRR76_002314 [Exophiala dermatitidis]
MADHPPDTTNTTTGTTTTTTNPNLLSTHRAIVETLASFLTVATHHILFLRRIYPPISFLSTRAYNYPVRQNRHHLVCNWILDAIAAVRDQLERNTVEKIALCIFAVDTNRVLERWTFDLHSFPVVAKRDRDIAFVTIDSTTTATTISSIFANSINIADLEAHFRATLSRISTAAARLAPLPEETETSFTMAIEVKDNADRPVGRLDKMERKWMAAEPEAKPKASPETELEPEVEGQLGHPHPETNNHTTTTNDNSNPKTQNQTQTPQCQIHGRTHPVRRLEAGELRIEVWVEESAAKFEYNHDGSNNSNNNNNQGNTNQPLSRAEIRTKLMSYGAGTERFDPGVPPNGNEDLDVGIDQDGLGLGDGFDLEPPDINRKPQGGATTDYQRG